MVAKTENQMTILGLIEEIIKLEESALLLLGNMTDVSPRESKDEPLSGTRFSILRDWLLAAESKMREINAYLECLTRQLG